MPKTRLVLFREDDGTIPLLKWLEELPDKVKDKSSARLRQLGELDHELRRPEADYLRDGIYELRVDFTGTNYRMLYFFHAHHSAVVTHGLRKERRVPPVEIERAVEKMKQFVANPSSHTAEMPL